MGNVNTPPLRPPIAPDVAEVIGSCAEKVESRSLLLDKFVLHKSWPLVFSELTSVQIKMDDASRWSFIRTAQNGEAILARELQRNRTAASGKHAKPENIERSEKKVEVLQALIPCACRKLPADLLEQKLAQNGQFAEMLERSRPLHAVVYGELGGRLIVNLSDSLIQNAGICLDRNTGLPLIPGSAVKGVTRHVALAALHAGEWTLDEFMAVFGASEADFKKDGELAAFGKDVPKERQTRKGGVDFLAARPITEPRIVVDITTVHNREYYMSGCTFDLAKEGPVPNTFPVVEKGVRYVFALVANQMGVGETLFAKARATLVEAITVYGIGAKTGAGYGWFTDVTEEVQADRLKKAATEAAKRAEQDRLAAEAKAKADRAAEIAALADLSPEERTLARWTKMGSVKAILGADIAKFAGLSEDDRKGVVLALRMPSGLGADVWNAIKGAAQDKKLKKLGIPATGDAIRGYCNKTLKLGKMP